MQDEAQVSDAVAMAFQFAVSRCPEANPSDLWQHVIYRKFMESKSDQQWKRVSGFALERALVNIYTPRLAPHGLRMTIVPKSRATRLLEQLDLLHVPTSKIDMFVERSANGHWHVIGIVHAKASIAERIQDDVPASRAFRQKGLLSVLITMDSKSFPPPHGNGVNHGELGGRSGETEGTQKRDYVEVHGQFDALFSYNRRTPPSPAQTQSGKRIFTMSLSEPQPDDFVRFFVENGQGP